MLLKNQKEDTTDYTKDWPARYYDIPAHCGANTLSVQKQKALPFLQIPTGKCSASGAFFPKKKTALWMVFSAPGP